jgi:hypothetical protein
MCLPEARTRHRSADTTKEIFLLTRPDALRDAELALRKQKRWASPFYWAAFVQHGDWK